MSGTTLSREMINTLELTRLAAFNYYHVYLCAQNKFLENSVKPVEEKPHILHRVVMAGVVTFSSHVYSTPSVFPLWATSWRLRGAQAAFRALEGCVAQCAGET